LQCPVAGWEDQHVSLADLEASPARPAQLDRRSSADDAEHLMGDRVEVVEREDPVAPIGNPLVGVEELLARARSVGRLNLAVDQDRQARVGESAVVLEEVRLGRHGVRA
jgi:hypothetical protein